MSTGNAAAAIGLANTSKIAQIGPYVQDVGALGQSGPSAINNFMGINGNTVHESNVMGEAIGFTAAGNSGAANNKVATWVTNTALLAAGTTRVDIAAGVVTANNSTGAHDIFIPIPAAGLAANKFFWAFTR